MGILKRKLRELAYGDVALRTEWPRWFDTIGRYSEVYRTWRRKAGLNFYNDPYLTITAEYPKWHKTYGHSGWWSEYTKFHNMYFCISLDRDSNTDPSYILHVTQFGLNNNNYGMSSPQPKPIVKRQYWGDVTTEYCRTEEELMAKLQETKDRLDVMVMEASL